MKHSRKADVGGDQSFPRKHRLLSAFDYKNVFKQPTKVSTPEFLFLFCENNQTSSRLGLAIAKKQFPHAVDRNRIKRLVRESFRKTRVQLNPVDIVVLGRRKLMNMDNTKIRSQLDYLWNKTIQRTTTKKSL